MRTMRTVAWLGRMAHRRSRVLLPPGQPEELLPEELGIGVETLDRDERARRQEDDVRRGRRATPDLAERPRVGQQLRAVVGRPLGERGRLDAVGLEVEDGQGVPPRRSPRPPRRAPGPGSPSHPAVRGREARATRARGARVGGAPKPCP